MEYPNKLVKIQHNIYPKFKNGDTVKITNESLELNNPYSNLFNSKTFIIENYKWNEYSNQFEYSFKPSIGKTTFLENVITRVYTNN